MRIGEDFTRYGLQLLEAERELAVLIGNGGRFLRLHSANLARTDLTTVNRLYSTTYYVVLIQLYGEGLGYEHALILQLVPSHLTRLSFFILQ